MRWRPTTKLGMNHYLIEDDWYEGYFIPKNSVIMLNQWALHYDEEAYPEPFKVGECSWFGLMSSTSQNGFCNTV
jgi:cytochrome P450